MNFGKAIAASMAAVALAAVPAFGAPAHPVGGGHATPISATAATPASTITPHSSKFEGWSCGYNSGRGIDPSDTKLTKVATDHKPISYQDHTNDIIKGELRNGWSSAKGRWFAWGRVSATYSFGGGAYVWIDWSDDAGRTYHACGWGNRPSYVADQTVTTHTKAVDWVRNRWVAVCIGSGGNPKTHSGGYTLGCTPWYLT
ncbi:hypothetical protein SRB17_81770 [Streptomyces sp. RB17]|uniref:hypothetical protein n=1 Tax=Streptomyces sp. RB17 TaxID=2585197 RepID=UPI0012975E78|nr:hypothetical protein [Streptomyces sp. RB17]MQY40147.1 hypothetical protein [Streptomyces sp. RB17]